MFPTDLPPLPDTGATRGEKFCKQSSSSCTSSFLAFSVALACAFFCLQPSSTSHRAWGYIEVTHSKTITKLISIPVDDHVVCRLAASTHIVLLPTQTKKGESERERER